MDASDRDALSAVVARQRATPPSNAPASIWLSMNATAAATPSRTAQAT